VTDRIGTAHPNREELGQAASLRERLALHEADEVLIAAEEAHERIHV
jgi:hypothetical protein